MRLLDLLFQFHKGTIKTILIMLTRYYSANFNSIKVRLKRQGFEGDYYPSKFQFHKGTIKTFGEFGRNTVGSISIP